MHRCVKCGTVYGNADNSILTGCNKCGSNYFFYLRSEKDVEQVMEMQKELEKKETTFEKEIDKQIKKIKSRRKVRTKKFGIETIRIPAEGVYEINIDGLMKRRPLIILEKKRAYIIHLTSAFERIARRI